VALLHSLRSIRLRLGAIEAAFVKAWDSVSRTLSGHRGRCLEVRPETSKERSLGVEETNCPSSLRQHSKQCLFIVGYLAAVADDLIAAGNRTAEQLHAAAAHLATAGVSCVSFTLLGALHLNDRWRNGRQAEKSGCTYLGAVPAVNTPVLVQVICQTSRTAPLHLSAVRRRCCGTHHTLLKPSARRSTHNIC
jgi:hypothetical protein